MPSNPTPPSPLTQSLLTSCTLCPRLCRVDRTAGRTGRCHASADLTVARAALHMWEEPCITGEGGSGTVFFSGCGLGCIYCQNQAISGGKAGKIISTERLGEIFLELQQKGAENINLVTPTHYTPKVIEALDCAKAQGLSIPIVYNLGGYELPEILRLYEGIVDVWLPDFKYMSEQAGRDYSGAPDYSVWAKRSLAEMVRQQPAPVFDGRGIMRRGVIVRHLLLPGGLADSKKVVEYLYRTYGDTIYISIMNQYTPVRQFERFPELNRRVTEKEYDELVDYAIDLGVENGFIQEGGTASESFIPEFDNEGV